MKLVVIFLIVSVFCAVSTARHYITVDLPESRLIKSADKLRQRRDVSDQIDSKSQEDSNESNNSRQNRELSASVNSESHQDESNESNNSRQGRVASQSQESELKTSDESKRSSSDNSEDSEES